MANKEGKSENLVNLADRPPEERLEIAKAGAAASVEARRKRKAMREGLELLLSLPSKNQGAVKQLQAMGVDVEDANNQMVMLAAVFGQAIKGDMQAAQFIRDTIGEKPTDKHAVEVDTGLLDDIRSQLGE